MKHLLRLFCLKGRDKKFDALQEKDMENLAIVVVFALTLVAIVALGRGIRGKLGGIEIATQQDSISGSKKKTHGSCHTMIVIAAFYR
jgi:hypothetical protein